ncbi:MAG: DHH family phosphoesterase [Bdellovibrionales bacterium]|nr:DHH family phosphoesterase [Bdellovibrionales bacterium]
MKVNNLVKAISKAQSIILSTHKQCDGDGLGAMLGLYHALKKVGKRVRVLTVDEVPARYNFLQPDKYSETYEGPHAPIENTDLALIFDTNDRRLVEPLFNELEEKVSTILFVDHHPVLNQGPEPTPGSYINTLAASTGEIAYFLIKDLGIHFDEKIAKSIYTSIAFDTQLFRYVKNSATSHLICAELIEHIPNSEDIHRSLFATHTIEKVQFLSKVLGEIEYFGDGRIAILKLHAKDLLDHNLNMDDSRDVIDMLMNINTLQAAALFREDDKDLYKMSLRSKGNIEVLGIAETFHGGGHMYAAGATVEGDFTKLKKEIVDLILNRLDGHH